MDLTKPTQLLPHLRKLNSNSNTVISHPPSTFHTLHGLLNINRGWPLSRELLFSGHFINTDTPYPSERKDKIVLEGVGNCSLGKRGKLSKTMIPAMPLALFFFLNYKNFQNVLKHRNECPCTGHCINSCQLPFHLFLTFLHTL